MTTGHYVHSETRAPNRPHRITHAEINEAFLKWGIIGKRRKINPVVRLMPYFDKGPGLGR